MKKIICIMLVFVMLFSLVGCNEKVETRKVDDVVMFKDTFDSKFISYISSNSTKNYMVSPLSFRYALGLLLSGAKGETLDELLKLFDVSSVSEYISYCEKFDEFIKSFYSDLDEELTIFNEGIESGWVDKDSPKPFRAIRVANSIWKNENISKEFEKKYIEYIDNKLGAEYFNFNKDNAVDKVNSWVSDKTEKMIEELLSEGFDAESLAVILMNALYFKDAWIKPFENIGECDFTTWNKEVVKKEFMKVKEDVLHYIDSETELVVIPMKGNVNIAFVVGSKKDLEEKINSAVTSLGNIVVPKLDLETSLDKSELVNFLLDNGVTTCFSDDADFSNMIDEDIKVSDIIQKTRIKLDEEGIEAAAVTAILMEKCALFIDDSFDFTLDKPFSFYIYSEYEGEKQILFAGEIIE